MLWRCTHCDWAWQLCTLLVVFCSGLSLQSLLLIFLLLLLSSTIKAIEWGLYCMAQKQLLLSSQSAFFGPLFLSFIPFPSLCSLSPFILSSLSFLSSPVPPFPSSPLFRLSLAAHSLFTSISSPCSFAQILSEEPPVVVVYPQVLLSVHLLMLKCIPCKGLTRNAIKQNLPPL